MTINHEKKLIFVHIPKNAGTSIIKAMGAENIFFDKTLEEYKEHYREYWDKYKKFTVVRDPIDRFISAYKFARMRESSWFSATGEEGLEKHTHHEICNKFDINEYVKFIYDKREYNRWIIPQTVFISNIENEIEIDYIIRYENLSEGLKKIGIDNIQKLNSSKIDDTSLISLTKKSKNMLHRIYYSDYQNFSYNKGSFFYQ